MNTHIFAHEILCAALFFTMFCRAVKTDSKIKADVRFAFFILGIVSCMGMAAPIAWDYQPTMYEISLLGAVVFVQMITSHHWRQEVPYQFVKTEYRSMRRRRASDSVGSHV